METLGLPASQSLLHFLVIRLASLELPKPHGRGAASGHRSISAFGLTCPWIELNGMQRDTLWQSVTHFWLFYILVPKLIKFRIQKINMISKQAYDSPFWALRRFCLILSFFSRVLWGLVFLYICAHSECFQVLRGKFLAPTLPQQSPGAK